VLLLSIANAGRLFKELICEHGGIKVYAPFTAAARSSQHAARSTQRSSASHATAESAECRSGALPDFRVRTSPFPGLLQVICTFAAKTSEEISQDQARLHEWLGSDRPHLPTYLPAGSIDRFDRPTAVHLPSLPRTLIVAPCGMGVAAAKPRPTRHAARAGLPFGSRTRNRSLFVCLFVRDRQARNALITLGRGNPKYAQVRASTRVSTPEYPADEAVGCMPMVSDRQSTPSTPSVVWLFPRLVAPVSPALITPRVLMSTACFATVGPTAGAA
jgi:hypothetical protein